MKVAFITNIFPKLSETFILNQVIGLIERGHSVDIYAHENIKESKVHPEVKQYGLLSNTYYLKVPLDRLQRIRGAAKIIQRLIGKHPGIMIRCMNVFKYGRRAFSLKLIHQVAPLIKDYDIIHCHFGTNGNWGVLLKELGIEGKLVTTFYGYDIRLGIEKGGEFYRDLFDYGDRFIAISEYCRDNLVHFGLEQKKIVDLPVGIDLTKFPFKWERQGFKSGECVRILTVARLVKEKGLTYGIHAIHKIHQKYPELKFTYRIIGDGPLKEELKSLSRELELDDIVHFTGPIVEEDFLKEFLQSHIFLLPSIAELLPVCLMESQSVGLPSVATAVGDTSKIILDGKSGFIVRSQDADGLAEKLTYLINNPLKWPEMGSVGRRHIENHYDINKLNDKLVQIYRDLL